MTVRSSNAPLALPSESVRVALDQWVRLRDGKRLHYIVYLPREASGPVPAIIELTPYGLDRRHGDAVYFASRGFAFVLADVRGRGDSEGEFDPMQNDGDDGYDLVQGIASQPWCSGRVGLYGSSYTGANQWVIAGKRPPALATIVPSAAGHFGMDVPVGGVPTSYYFRWRALTTGRQQYFDLFSDSALWHAAYADALQDGGQLANIGERIGLADCDLERFFDNPQLGPHWTSVFPSPTELAAMDIPVLNVGGQYDGTQLGHLRLYHQLERNAQAAQREKNFLVMGPWDHSGIMHGSTNVGDLRFDPKAQLDIRELKSQWYDWTLRDGARPSFLDARVKYYVTGREEWFGAPSLDAVTREHATLFFSSQGDAHDVFHSGRLNREIGGAASDSFRVEAHDLRPAEIERRPRVLDDVLVGRGVGANYWVPWNDAYFALIGEAPTSQALAMNLFGHGLVYHSAPFDEPLELAGYPQAELHLSFDVADVDLMVLLYEILTDGSSIFLSSQMQRLRHHRVAGGAAPGPLDRPRAFVFDGMRFFARSIARNSRLRCVIRSPSSLSFERNPHSRGTDIPERAHESPAATVTLHHCEAHPSALYLPLARAGRQQEPSTGV